MLFMRERSNTGRPSVDPELMIRMLIIGYCFGIRSERRLCEEVHLNLAYRWFCRRPRPAADMLPALAAWESVVGSHIVCFHCIP
jgi:hypothetical protein